MTFINFLLLYPLQISAGDFWKKQDAASGKDTVFLIVLFFIIIAAVVFVGSLRGKSSVTGGGKGSTGLFAKLALRRMGRDIGLNSEQIKMLDFVFKTDQVVDPEKSIITPVLLDRHFRHAYRVIEQSSKTDEEIQYRHAILFSTRNILENNVSGGIYSTRQLTDDISINISTNRDKYQVRILSTSGESLAVACPINALGSSVKLQRGTSINALLFTKNNKGFSFETHVTGYNTIHGKNALLLAHSNKLKFLSHRRFRRRQMVIACNLYIVYVEGSGKRQRLVVDKRRLSGNIADISVGGCSIKVKAPIQVGAKLKIEFTQGDYSVAALGQVLRTNRMGLVTVAHVKFLKVSRKSMNLINAFVYEYINE